MTDASDGGAASPEPSGRGDRRKALLTAAAALALATAVAVLLPAAGDDAETGGDQAAAEVDGDPALGEPDAPVTIVEYSDFRCPYCQRHFQETKPEIVERYVETGAVRYVWRDLPLQGDDSVRAALAARAAQEQGAFWQYHEALFSGEPAGFGREDLTALAADLGLHAEAFAGDLESERHVDLVRAGFDEAQRLGISGTPAFTIEDEVIVGAQPIEVFVEHIEDALAAAR